MAGHQSTVGRLIYHTIRVSTADLGTVTGLATMTPPEQHTWEAKCQCGAVVRREKSAEKPREVPRCQNCERTVSVTWRMVDD